MTEHLDKQTLTRLAWITELRRQGDRQCRGAYEGDNNVCAMVLLGEIVWPKRIRKGAGHSLAVLGALGDKAGLTAHQVLDVVEMNDGSLNLDIRQHTFAEIADVVEGWFK